MRSSTSPLLRPVPWLLAAGLVAAALYFATQIATVGPGLGFPLDDSWIHLAFAHSLAGGEGMAYNAGELVTGSTAPLWTAVVALLLLLPGNPLAWIQLAGVALYLAGGHATYRLGRELGLSRRLAALAAAMTLATYWLVWAALSGMEIPLFVLLSLWGMILHLRERRAGTSAPPLSLGVLAAAALARPEGALLLALAIADRLLVLRRDDGDLRLLPPPWRSLGVGLGLAALALLPALAFYALVGGSATPTTFTAKAEPQLALPQLRYLHLVLGIFFKPQPFLTLLAAAGAVRLAERLGTERDRGLLPALWVAALPLAYALLSPPDQPLVGNFGRYFFPLFPPLLVLGVMGLEPLAQLLAAAGRRRGQRGKAAVLALQVAALALLAAPTLEDLATNRKLYARNLANVRDSVVATGRWLAANVPGEAVLAVQDVGAIKVMTGCRVIDLAGLVTPEILPASRAAVAPDDPTGDAGVYAFLAQRRPDFLVVYPRWYPKLTADRRFKPLHRQPVPGNITMAGDELVVYATPWCRYLRRPEAPPEAPPEVGDDG